MIFSLKELESLEQRAMSSAGACGAGESRVFCLTAWSIIVSVLICIHLICRKLPIEFPEAEVRCSARGGTRAVPFYGALLSVDGTEMSSRMNIIT